MMHWRLRFFIFVFFCGGGRLVMLGDLDELGSFGFVSIDWLTF